MTGAGRRTALPDRIGQHDGQMYRQITNHANYGEYCRIVLADGDFLGGVRTP